MRFGAWWLLAMENPRAAGSFIVSTPHHLAPFTASAGTAAPELPSGSSSMVRDRVSCGASRLGVAMSDMTDESRELMRRITAEIWDEGRLDRIDRYIAEDLVDHIEDPTLQGVGRERYRET